MAGVFIGGGGRGKELKGLLKLFEQVCLCSRWAVYSPLTPQSLLSGLMVVFPRDDALDTEPVFPKTLELKRASAGEGSAKGTLGKKH